MAALYTDLSAYYDLMCAAIDYKEQCEAAHRLHHIFGSGGNTYLDLGCGTGPHVEHFITYGYHATGLDLNQPMLDRAALRCPEAAFSLQDMSDFSFPHTFDLITCFLYSVHYCYPYDTFVAMLTCAFAALSPGGVLCFDAVDKHAIANDEGYKHSTVHGNSEFHFQSRWHYAGEGEKLDLHISIQKETDGKHSIWQDQHTMLAIEITALKALLEHIGFECVLLERDFTKVLEWDTKVGNVLVVCTKPSL